MDRYVDVEIRSEASCDDRLGILDRVHDFPSLSGIILQLEYLISDPNSSARDLENMIKVDPALTARILRVVNSGYYGLRQRIGSLGHAIAFLGFDEIKTIVLTSEVFTVFPAKSKNRFDRYEFWKHSVATACGASLLGHLLRIEDSDRLFVAGLLHDIGKLIFEDSSPEKFYAVLDTVRASGRDMADAERDIFGIDHCQVTRCLAQKWRFPSFLADVLGNNYYATKSGTFFAEVSCIRIAESCARLFMCGSDGEHNIPEIPNDVLYLIEKTDMPRVTLLQRLLDEMTNATMFLDSFI